MSKNIVSPLVEKYNVYTQLCPIVRIMYTYSEMLKCLVTVNIFIYTNYRSKGIQQ